MTILIILLILIFVFGSGGFYTSRAGYEGPNVGGLLWVLLVVVVVILVVQLVVGALP